MRDGGENERKGAYEKGGREGILREGQYGRERREERSIREGIMGEKENRG